MTAREGEIDDGGSGQEKEERERRSRVALRVEGGRMEFISQIPLWQASCSNTQKDRQPVRAVYDVTSSSSKLIELPASGRSSKEFSKA